MRRLTYSLIVALFAGAPTTAADLDAGGDLSRLQGRWTACVGPGRDIRVELEIEGQRARVVIGTPQGLSYRVRGEVRLDETKTPRALDWSRFIGLDGQELPEISAIYRLEGDRWTVCNGGFNGPRPGEFRPGDGLLADVVVFERPQPEARSGASAPIPGAPSSPAAREGSGDSPQ